MILPPLELIVDELGRRCVPLASLLYVLEAAMEEEGATLGLLRAAVQNASEAPLPGLTPERADQLRTIPGFEFAEEAPGGMHPGAVAEESRELGEGAWAR